MASDELDQSGRTVTRTRFAWRQTAPPCDERARQKFACLSDFVRRQGGVGSSAELEFSDGTYTCTVVFNDWRIQVRCNMKEVAVDLAASGLHTHLEKTEK